MNGKGGYKKAATYHKQDFRVGDGGNRREPNETFCAYQRKGQREVPIAVTELVAFVEAQAEQASP